MLNFKDKLKSKKILIYGFGKTGKSCFNFLKKNNQIKIYDDNHKTIPKNIKNNYFIKIFFNIVNFYKIIIFNILGYDFVIIVINLNLVIFF